MRNGIFDNFGGSEMPFSERDKARIRNMLGYFVKNAEKVRFVTLFKMLFNVDRLSYIERGIPVTGYTYYAKENGPVPLQLEHELKGILSSASWEKDESVGARSVIRLERPKTPKAEPEEQFFKLTSHKWRFNNEILTPSEIDLLDQTLKRGEGKTGNDWIKYGHREWPSWIKPYYDEEQGDGSKVNLDDELDGSYSYYSEEDHKNMAAARYIAEWLVQPERDKC
jgi:hypothetical protein